MLNCINITTLSIKFKWLFYFIVKIKNTFTYSQATRFFKRVRGHTHSNIFHSYGKDRQTIFKSLIISQTVVHLIFQQLESRYKRIKSSNLNKSWLHLHLRSAQNALVPIWEKMFKDDLNYTKLKVFFSSSAAHWCKQLTSYFSIQLQEPLTFLVKRSMKIKKIITNFLKVLNKWKKLIKQLLWYLRFDFC